MRSLSIIPTGPLTLIQFAQIQSLFKRQGGGLKTELACLLILLITTVTWLLGDTCSIHSYNIRSDHKCIPLPEL